MGTQLPLPKKGAQPPIIGPCLWWPNGWMDQAATWCEGRPRPGPHCVRRGPSSTFPKEHSPQFLACVCCGQTAGWIKMPLGTKVGLGTGHIVLHGDPGPSPPKRGHRPNFWPMSIAAKWSPTSATVEHFYNFYLTKFRNISYNSMNSAYLDKSEGSLKSNLGHIFLSPHQQTE